MLKNLIIILTKNKVIITLFLVIAITVSSSTYQNYNKNLVSENYNNLFSNLYFKKTINHIIDNLEPKYKKIDHKILSGETFDKILEEYLINTKEILEIKKELSRKVNLNKLNTNQKIQLTIDSSNNLIKDFTFQISNTEKIYLTKNFDTNSFNQQTIVLKLKKEILYKENIILQSLYKSASEQNIPANTIIEFARIYGFQVDFQRDIRKKDRFQIMYEVFIDENDKIIVF